MTDNRTTELRISEPLRGFIRHQSNRAYIDGGQARWLTKIADEIDAKHEQAVDDARIVEVTTSHIDIEQGEVITRFVPEQAIAATLENEREKKLEELVKQLWYLVNHRSGYGYAAALESIDELGIEVVDNAD